MDPLHCIIRSIPVQYSGQGYSAQKYMVIVYCVLCTSTSSVQKYRVIVTRSKGLLGILYTVQCTALYCNVADPDQGHRTQVWELDN